MNGIIIINKEKGYTSHDVVAKLKRILNIKKVGHTGTLDPNATGVLPILLGEGTKLSKYLINHDKTYIATIKLGEKRDTADIEGNVIETASIDISKINKENINSVLESFIGKQEQKPPMYSAIKIKGKKLYEYARKGESVEVKPRIIEIYNIKLIDIKENDEIIFEVKCSKGTYIRTLCEDIAEKLGTVGYMKDLQRTQVGEFHINQAINLEKLEEKREKVVITIEDFFKAKEEIKLDKKRLKMFLNGISLNQDEQDEIYRIYTEENEFVGIGKIEEKKLKRDIIVKK